MRTSKAYTEMIEKAELRRAQSYALVLRHAARLAKFDKEIRRLKKGRRNAKQFERRVAAAPRPSGSSPALADR